MERFECKQTMFLAVDRMSREDLSVQDMAENTCEVTVVSPLSIFVALRGPPLKLDEDGTLELAERLYFEGNAPGPFWVTLSAEYGSVTAEGDGVYSNGTKNYLHFKVDTVEWLMALMESKEVKLLPAQHFWGTDYLYIGLQSSLDPPNASNVGGRELTLGLNYSMQIEVVPKRDEPQIYMAHGSTAVAQADKAHQVNASIVYVDLAATGHARVHVKSPFGELSFPELDVMMDEEAPGLTEFFADQEFDQEVEEEYATRIPARNGVWPTVSRYETSTGDGFTLSGEVSALNRVLAQLRFTPPADSPNSGALTVSLQRTPSSVDWESESSAGTFQTEEVLAQKDFAVAIEPLAKSKFTCFIGGPAVTFVNPGEESRDGGVTVYPEASASVEVTKAVAEELHEFRVSVKHGTLGLDVNKFPAARICPPFYPDVGGCAQDEVDAWVIYGRIADAALALESLVYTPPIGYAGQDLMRITGSCSEVSLEVKMNIIKGFLPPVVRCCEHEVMEVHRALEPAPVPPAILESNAYGEIPAVAQVRFTTDLGQLAFWPVQGLYFDHGFDVAPIHNVSSQIVADGPGAIVQHGLGSKLALLHIPETEPRVEGTLVVEVLDARSGLSSSCTCPIKVSAYRREGLPLISIDMPTPNTTFLLSGLGVRSWELTVPSFGLISAAFRTPCYVKLSVPRGRLVPPVPPPWRQAAEWREDKQGSYSLLAESVEDASDVVGKLRFLIQEEELDSREPLILAMSIEVFALPSGQQKDLDQAILRDQRDMQLEIRTEPSIPQLWMMTKRMEIQHAERISLERLNLQLLYPRPLVLQLSCEACTFFDEEFSSNSTYQITGMASVLQNHVAQLQMQVTCAVCDFEELLVKAWDPETLQLPSSQTDQGNLIVQVTCPVMIETSPIAKGPPLLRVQSSGVVVQAGESVDLKQLGLQSADPNEPLGLHAVVDHVEVRLSSRQGTLEIDVAALVGATEPYLADAADGAFTANTWSQDQVQVAVTGAEMSGEPFNIPSTNRRVPYVEPSRPANPENRTLLDARGALRPPRVLWTGKSLRLRGPAVQMQMTLSSVKYTADESGGGWDTVTMSMGMQTAELPLYIIRQVGEIVLKASPLKTMVAGHFLKPEIQAWHSTPQKREAGR
ncbi:Dihydropyridine-sensitive L-type skeletal muscle calcium channel subunit alpha-1 [Durusdinium trenchii]|uniref:Dihydropyridine-sensitive L-type skeletal muscle calcium channel subunit alpha-1 n=1 Tax=Durusdinium trenchii TaxID=1381693 RepID=A0ABP0LRG1_9DINO